MNETPHGIYYNAKTTMQLWFGNKLKKMQSVAIKLITKIIAPL